MIFAKTRTQASAERARDESFSDLLPWIIPVADGVVQTKRGAFVAAFYFSPPDSVSMTGSEQDQISQRLNEAMLRFGTGWASWTDAIVVEAAGYPAYEASHFPDDISRAIDEERRAVFDREGEHFSNERVFALSWTPPNSSVSRIEKLLYTGGTTSGVAEETLPERHLAAFEHVLEQFEVDCSEVFPIRRMRSYAVDDEFGSHQSDELVDYLNYCVTGRTGGVALPRQGCFLDVLLGGGDFSPGDIPVLGGEFIAVVSIDGFPAESSANMLSALSSLAMPYRFTQRMIYLDGVHADKEIEGYSKKWSSKVTPVMSKFLNVKNAPINAHAQAMVNDAGVARSLVDSGLVKYGFYSPTVIVRHDDYETLMAMVKEVRRMIKACRFESRLEGVNTVEAFRGSLPGDERSNVRRPPFHTANLADLLPLSGVWTGSPVAPSPMYPANSPPLMVANTIGSIPCYLNLHVNDVGHTLVFGPTGTGKSALMNSVAIQARRYQGSRIICFDNKRGMMATALACRGRHFELVENGQPLFCPFASLDTESDRMFAQSWVSSIYELHYPHEPIQPDQMDEIKLAIERMAQKPGHRSMTDFQLAVSDAKVKQAMKFYTLEGSAGFLFDAKQDLVEGSDFVVYEMLEVMEMGEKITLPLLSLMFRRVERSLDGRPTFLFLSEVWTAFRHKTWRDRIESWLRLMRSKNCAVIMDTQSLSDAFKSGMMDLINSSCPTKIFLPNVNAFDRGNEDGPGDFRLYEMLGLNENQIGIIQGAKRKRDAYWTSPVGRRLVAIEMTPLQKAIAGLTDEKDVLEVHRLLKLHGDGWLDAYLNEKGIQYARNLTPADA